ncbi:hypothetical protein C8R46DRAFT_1293716 [Mycena filopes]|nr:hypothetical protein C8R46DRAFT_1293716 [Mycena filopes]
MSRPRSSRMEDIPPNPPRWKPNPDPASIVVPGLDSTAPLLDQIEQMEQLITIKLQNVDENFAKIHSILANKILPAVKRYAVGTKPVKEAANFWVSFYEQAAQIRIPTFDDHSTVNEVPSEREDLTSDAGSSSEMTETDERTVRHEDHSMASTENSFMPGQAAFASTPATARAGHTMSTDDPSWSASLESPLARLDREVQNFSLEDSSDHSKLPSLRFNDPSEVDDDTIIRPRVDKGKGKESAEPLLRNVLRNTLTSDPSFSTLSPTKGKLKTPVPNGLNPYLPPDTTPANWSGLVDLRHTPLSTPLRKKHGGYEESDDDSFDGLPPGMSPPVLMSPAKPPRSSAELQLLRGKTPAKVAASRIKNDLVRDIQRQNSAKARKVHGYAMSGGESSMSTVSSPPSLSRYNRHDTDESAVDTSLESVMQRVVLNPPTWTPAASTPGLRLRPKASALRADPLPAPNYLAQYQEQAPLAADFSPPATPQHYDDFDSDSDSLENEINNTAHPSAAFLMATQGSRDDDDDDDDSQDSLERADVGTLSLDEGAAIMDVHPFARGGFAYTGADDSFDETFALDAEAGREETVFGFGRAPQGQARMSEHGELLMYGDGDGASVPDTLQYGMVGSSPTPHWPANSRG